MSLTNLTPHPFLLYPPDVPDRFEVGMFTPLEVIAPSADPPPARLGMIELGTHRIGAGVPVEYVEYVRGANGGLERPLPPQVEGQWFIVSLVVGLTLTYYASPGRSDLLVPYREVRDPAGTVIGCRGLALPV